MRLIVYAELFAENKLYFRNESENLSCLKNNLQSDTIIDLDNFSDKDFIEMVCKSLEKQTDFILIINMVDPNAELGIVSFLLQKIQYLKPLPGIYLIGGVKIPSFFKPVVVKSIDEIVQSIN